MKKLLLKLGIEDLPSFWAFVKQFIKFGIVGVSNTLISLGIYYTLVYFGVHYLLANLIAFLLSVLNAYFWNSRFVFKSKGNVLKKLVKVYAAYGFTLLLSTTLLYLMVDIIGISQLIAPLINIAITVPINFLLNKFWSFKQTDIAPDNSKGHGE